MSQLEYIAYINSPDVDAMHTMCQQICKNEDVCVCIGSLSMQRASTFMHLQLKIGCCVYSQVIQSDVIHVLNRNCL